MTCKSNCARIRRPNCWNIAPLPTFFSYTISLSMQGQMLHQYSDVPYICRFQKNYKWSRCLSISLESDFFRFQQSTDEDKLVVVPYFLVPILWVRKSYPNHITLHIVTRIHRSTFLFADKSDRGQKIKLISFTKLSTSSRRFLFCTLNEKIFVPEI